MENDNRAKYEQAESISDGIAEALGKSRGLPPGTNLTAQLLGNRLRSVVDRPAYCDEYGVMRLEKDTDPRSKAYQVVSIGADGSKE